MDLVLTLATGNQEWGLVTREKLDAVEHNLDAKKVWLVAVPGIMLMIQPKTINMFQFTEGVLYTDYMCEKNISSTPLRRVVSCPPQPQSEKLI
jgi:hypothetical protein